MTITLTTTQANRKANNPLSMVTLVKHTIFSDYTTAAVGKTHYWSTPYSLLYTYGGTVRQFRNRIASLDPVDRS